MTDLASLPTLRPAAAADVDAIAALWHSGWLDGHLGHVPAVLHRYRRPDDFRRRVPGRLGQTTVAVLADDLVGFVTVRDDEIEQLYVAEPLRGGVTAPVLIAHGEEAIAARYEVAWLAVVDGNVRARRFYARRGWSDAGAIDYPAETLGGETVPVPSRRYEKRLVAAGLERRVDIP